MLLYQLEQAPSERAVLLNCQRCNLPIPDKFKNAPELLPGLGIYLDAFFELSNYRSFGFSELPIEWATLNEYCNQHDIYGDQRDDAFSHIKVMDRVYLEHRAKNGQTQQL